MHGRRQFTEPCKKTVQNLPPFRLLFQIVSLRDERRDAFLNTCKKGFRLLFGQEMKQSFFQLSNAACIN